MSFKEKEKAFYKENEIDELEVRIARAKTASMEIKQKVKRAKFDILRMEDHIEAQTIIITEAEVRLNELQEV